MKTNFDLTPVVRSGSCKFITKITLSALFFVVLVKFLGYYYLAEGLFCGVVAATVDLVILFIGMKRSLPYVDFPKHALKIMKRFRWLRVASAACFIILMLRMKLHVPGAFGGFLLIHIFFIINLLFIAYQLTNERNVKKGV